MAKPSYTSTALDYASDANYDVQSDEHDGTATKVEPSAGIIAQAARPERQLGAQHFNWILNQFATIFADVIENLDEIETENLAQWDFFNPLPALNWRRLTAAIALTTSRPFFNAGLGAWIVPGDEAIGYSFDCGNTIASFGSVSDVTGEVLTNGDSDASGDMVIATESRYVFRYASGVWSRVDVYGFGGGVYELTPVVHDPIRDRWVWFFANVNQFTVKTSADGGATWAAASTPPTTNWDSGDLYLTRLAVKKSTGRIVAIAQTFDAGDVDVFCVATSDDGGVNWTTRANIVDAGTPDSTRSDLTYDEANDVWYFVHGEATTPTSRLYTSTDDGVTWTLVSTLTTRCIRSLACLDRVLVAVVENDTSVYEIAWSTDAGVTWHNTQFRSSSGDIRAGRGDLMIAGTGYILTSLRAGLVGDEIA